MLGDGVMTTWKFPQCGLVPLGLFPFSLMVAGTGMFLAFKWHGDR